MLAISPELLILILFFPFWLMLAVLLVIVAGIVFIYPWAILYDLIRGLFRKKEPGGNDIIFGVVR